jgi:hypothetical protein
MNPFHTIGRLAVILTGLTGVLLASCAGDREREQDDPATITQRAARAWCKAPRAAASLGGPSAT